MSLAFGIKVLLEVLVVLLIAYGLWHEDELIKFEQRLIKKIKRRLLNGRNRRMANNGDNCIHILAGTRKR